MICRNVWSVALGQTHSRSPVPLPRANTGGGGNISNLFLKNFHHICGSFFFSSAINTEISFLWSRQVVTEGLIESFWEGSLFCKAIKRSNKIASICWMEKPTLPCGLRQADEAANGAVHYCTWRTCGAQASGDVQVGTLCVLCTQGLCFLLDHTKRSGQWQSQENLNEITNPKEKCLTECVLLWNILVPRSQRQHVLCAALVSCI